MRFHLCLVTFVNQYPGHELNKSCHFGAATRPLTLNQPLRNPQVSFDPADSFCHFGHGTESLVLIFCFGIRNAQHIGHIEHLAYLSQPDETRRNKVRNRERGKFKSNFHPSDSSQMNTQFCIQLDE
jgi:hypothetical protein